MTKSNKVELELNVRIEKADFDAKCIFSELPEVSQEYLIRYGFKQAMQDCVASKEAGAEASEAVTKRFENLKNGIVPRIGGGGSRDPKAMLMKGYAEAMLAAACGGKSKITEVARSKNLQRSELIALVVTKHKEDFEARADVDLAKEPIAVDLEGIL